jgi:hypothetical protein
MNNDLNNIPPNNNAEKNALLQKLNKDIFSEEENMDLDFETDANIGLEAMSADKVDSIVHSLNTDLSRHLSKKNKRRGIFKDPSNINITIITILVLIIISYIIIKKILG